MWQRIQTLYLSLAILLGIFLFALDFAILTVEETNMAYTIWGVPDLAFNNYWLVIINSIAILVSILATVMFKKRNLQIKLCQLLLFIQAAFIAAIFFFVEDAVQLDEGASISYSMGTFIALVPIIAIYLATRAIKKDEALVRAADRIR